MSKGEIVDRPVKPVLPDGKIIDRPVKPGTTPKRPGHLDVDDEEPKGRRWKPAPPGETDREREEQEEREAEFQATLRGERYERKPRGRSRGLRL